MDNKIFIRGLSKDLWKQVKIAAISREMTLATAVEEALTLWLRLEESADGKGINWDGLTSIGGSGRRDISEKHDRFLAPHKLSGARK
jgi:hypothetical protein